MLTGRTILVAEDEPFVRLDLTAALVGVGATVCRQKAERWKPEGESGHQHGYRSSRMHREP
jgi:hypothetical protein